MTGAKIWRGDRQQMTQMHPVVWTFTPVVAATICDKPVPLGQTIHVLDAAGVVWTGGHPPESPAAVRAEYLDAARRIVGRGDALSRHALAEETFRSETRTIKRMQQHGVSLASLKRALRET